MCNVLQRKGEYRTNAQLEPKLQSATIEFHSLSFFWSKLVESFMSQPSSQSTHGNKEPMAQFGIDTLRVARDLEAAGAERKQAEATAVAINEAVGSGHRNLATKAETERLGGKMEHLDGKMERLEGKMERLEGKMEHLEEKMERMERQMATKDDLGRFEARMEVRFANFKVDVLRAFWIQGGAIVAALGGIVAIFAP